MLAKFMNMIMFSGKKSVAEQIVYGALDRISDRTGKDGSNALELLGQALDNVKPSVEVKSRRVGGATYQVPVEVRATRRETLAMRWTIEAARKRSEKTSGQMFFTTQFRIPEGPRPISAGASAGGRAPGTWAIMWPGLPG